MGLVGAWVIRKIETAPGATAVQIVGKGHGVQWIVEHVGSALTAAQLAVPVQAGRKRLCEGQQVLDLDIPAPSRPGRRG